MPDPKPTDKTALMALGLAASVLANFLLLSQLFVGRPEYLAELRGINARLSNIESHLGIYNPPSNDPKPER